MATGIDSLARLNPVQARKQELGHTIFGMQHTGHHKWGLLIYRTTYADDAAWDRYMAHLRSCAAESLEFCGRAAELGPHLQWTVVEDRSGLDGATKEHVQARFRTWVAERSVARDGPGADADERMLFATVPRYRWCLCIDDECLASLAHPIEAKAVVVDRDHGRDERPLTEEELQELADNDMTVDDLDDGGVAGCWMYIGANQYVSFYERAAGANEWRDLYQSPPGVWRGF